MEVISVNDIAKAYKQYPTRWARLAEWISPFRKSKHQLKWVLQNINFTVSDGEAVGIVGTNGAGKSTLLKMITGTLKPTAGKIMVNGQVAALLELGMGFHPDFTGRQNVLLSGQLMGMSAGQLTTLMPEIEAFAEISDYIDQPVRVYSSGMQMRLAFSVATAKRPDILIVDEALSVGDTYFQHKSFERIRQFREQGTTLLIVSHDKSAIQAICDRAILLNEGEVALEGDPEHVMDYYNGLIAERENASLTVEETQQGKQQTTSGTGEATIANVVLLNDKNQSIEQVEVGQSVTLSIDIDVNEGVDELVVGYVIKDRLGQTVFGTNTHQLQQELQNLQAKERINYQFEFDLKLGEGSYSIAVALHSSDTHLMKNYQWKDLVYTFNVININKKPFIGVTWLPPEVRCNRG